MDNDDYLYLGPLFIEHIREKVPGLVDVKGLSDLANVSGMQEHSPAVYVIYLGDDLSDTPAAQGGLRKTQVVAQLWAIVLSINVADPNDDGEEARREAGPLIGKLILALTGWLPAGCNTPVARSPHKAPVSYFGGHAYFPLIFKTRFIFPRNPT